MPSSMAHGKTATWGPAAALMLAAVLHLLIPMQVVEGIGVNYGTQAAQILSAKTIVQMLKDNKIDQVKLFDANSYNVEAFYNTGIEVMLGIPNMQLASLADSYGNAKDWVKHNLTKHLKDGRCKIRFVAVGNEPFLTSYNGSNLKTTFPALQNIQRAINDAGLGDKVKATIPQNADVYDSGSEGPSAGNFRKDIRDTMVQIVRFFRDNNAPFVVNIYPFLSLYLNPDFPVEFAFFDGGAQPVNDKGISYNNMLDANLDTLVWSLRKAGAPKVKIIIGEIGWPTDGHAQANVKMAKKFYDGYFKKMAAKKGTPLYPESMESYLFSLTDENQKSIAPGDFERHWGIFRYDGQPKFPMDFTGKGQEKMPVGAKDVTYLESKWCVFNSDIKIMDKVQKNLEFACDRSDCTVLNAGSSCGKMAKTDRVSYAFNNYYQMNNQDVDACQFEGLAMVVKTNASIDQCLFPIGLQRASGWRVGLEMGASVFAGLLVLLVMF